MVSVMPCISVSRPLPNPQVAESGVVHLMVITATRSWLSMTPSMLLAIYEYEYSSHHHLDSSG